MANKRARVKVMPRKVYRDSELIYAAHARCSCGAGFAYAPGGHMRHWDCSDILTGRAAPIGCDGSVKHDDVRPFIFWEILSEKQPSAQGATTRARTTPVMDNPT